MYDDKNLWTLSGLAEEFELNWRTVKKRMKNVPPDGKTRHGHDGWYLSNAIDAIRCKSVEAIPTNPSEMDARDRLYHYQAESLKMKIAKQKSQLVKRDEAEEVFESVRDLSIELFTNLPDEFRKSTDLPDKAIRVLERECQKMIDSFESKVFFEIDS